MEPKIEKFKLCFMQKIFSIINEQDKEKPRKILCIFGIRIKSKIFDKMLSGFYRLKMQSFKNRYKFARFRYSYYGFKKRMRAHNYSGFYNVNIGDNVQALAIKNLYETLGIQNTQCIDRDTMHKYKGEPLRVMMNAVIYERSFPYKDKILPYFIGTNLYVEENFKELISHLKAHEPIGCRDIATYEKLMEANVKAYITGCYSITLPKREKAPSRGKVFFVEVSEELKKHIPGNLLKDGVFIEHYATRNTFPSTEEGMAFAEKRAAELLQMYRDEAALIVTPLLHCASPCIGMGIPVILARDEDNPRFSAIKKITKLYLKEDYVNIDWNPKIVDVEELKKNMIEHARVRLLEDRVDKKSLEYLNKLFLA